MAKPDWITLSKTSGSGNDTVTVTASKNTSSSARSGSIQVKSGSITRTVSVSQEGAKLLALEWVTNPIPSKSFKRGTNSVSAALSLKNVLNAQFAKPLSGLKGEIYSVNGEESGEIIDITTWGFSFSSTIIHVQSTADGGNQVMVTINLNFDNPQAYAVSVGNTAYSEDSYGSYSSFIVEVGVQGMDGEYAYVDWDITVYQEALSGGSIAGEITLNPESASMGPEESCQFNVNYDNIIPETIKFVSGPEMQNSDGTVYLDAWDTQTGNEPASGSFSFSIACNSEAMTESYSFDVTGEDADGTTYTASGTVDIA